MNHYKYARCMACITSESGYSGGKGKTSGVDEIRPRISTVKQVSYVGEIVRLSKVRANYNETNREMNM
jgi:hypothetical protein